MPTSNRLVFPHSLTSESVTSRTAVYGPVRTVVWQGSVGDRRPYADLVRQGVDRLLATQSGISREERIQRAMRVAGRFKSGSSDVSTHHDRYLADAYDDNLR